MMGMMSNRRIEGILHEYQRSFIDDWKYEAAFSSQLCEREGRRPPDAEDTREGGEMKKGDVDLK